MRRGLSSSFLFISWPYVLWSAFSSEIHYSRLTSMEQVNEAFDQTDEL